MNFKEALLEAALQANDSLNKKQKAAINLAKTEKHKLLWKALENRVRVSYERDTGEKLPASFDWSTILAWIIKNLPTILSILLMLFGV